MQNLATKQTKQTKRSTIEHAVESSLREAATTAANCYPSEQNYAMRATLFGTQFLGVLTHIDSCGELTTEQRERAYSVATKVGHELARGGYRA